MSRAKQGFRVELAPTAEQLAAMGRHAGLCRFVENFCLDKIRAAFAQRAAEQTYGVPQAQLTKAPWSAIDLEKLWRAEHARVAPKVWAADRWFPSSKTCGDCGSINAGLTLSDRSWVCLCGVVHDRDHNAARNLLAAMHAA